MRKLMSAIATHLWQNTDHLTSIRFATHLYAEHLLDRDHYMDWLVAGLENTTQAKLPMWLLISQIYWKDLLRLRKYGRRLVCSVVNHYNAVCTPPLQLPQQ